MMPPAEDGAEVAEAAIERALTVSGVPLVKRIITGRKIKMKVKE